LTDVDLDHIRKKQRLYTASSLSRASGLRVILRTFIGAVIGALVLGIAGRLATVGIAVISLISCTAPPTSICPDIYESARSWRTTNYLDCQRVALASRCLKEILSRKKGQYGQRSKCYLHFFSDTLSDAWQLMSCCDLYALDRGHIGGQKICNFVMGASNGIQAHNAGVATPICRDFRTYPLSLELFSDNPFWLS
jgi:hypothetical protein